MPRGVKTSEKVVEEVIALYNVNTSISAIARQMKLGKATVSDIVNKYKANKPDEYEHIRTTKKIEFIEDTTGVLKDLLGIFIRRVQNLSEGEEKLTEVISLISSSDMSESSKGKLISKMQALLCPKITDITTAFGTMYDKLERMKLEGDEQEGSGVVELPKVRELTPPADDEEGINE